MWIVAVSLMVCLADEISFEGVLRHRGDEGNPYYLFTLTASGDGVSKALAYKPVRLSEVIAGGKKLKSGPAGIELRERISDRDTRLRAAARILPATSKAPDRIDRIAGVLPLLTGGTDHETRVTEFRHKKKRKLAIPELKETGGSLSVWYSESKAVVFRATQGREKVKSVDYDGPFIHRFATDDPADPYLAIHQPKIPKGLAIVVETRDGSEIRIERFKVGRTVTTLKHEDLAAEGIEISVMREPRYNLHLMTSGDDSCIRVLNLETDAGIIESESARAVPGVTDAEDVWIYPEIPEGAYLRVVVRTGAEWVEKPFSLTDVTFTK